jgi:hypothetical protein
VELRNLTGLFIDAPAAGAEQQFASETARAHAIRRAPTDGYSVGSTIVTDQDFATTCTTGGA